LRAYPLCKEFDAQAAVMSCNINIRQASKADGHCGIMHYELLRPVLIKHIDNSVVELIGMIASWTEREHHRIGRREHQYHDDVPGQAVLSRECI